MAQKIESDKLFIKDIFQRWYRIPEYQRPYVWEVDQVSELIDDVSRACEYNPESQYFLGSLVLRKSNIQYGMTKFEEYEVLDGQQRLITLILITAVVRDLTPSSNEVLISTCRNTIFQKANPYDNIPERSRIIFDIREQVSNFIDQYIKKDGGTQKIEEIKKLSQTNDGDISIKNMANAILCIREYLNKINFLDKFFTYLRSNVLMIYVAAEELEDAFHLFTVMNTRGVKLRNSDILKVENLAKLSDQNERIKYAKIWENIETYFAEDFDNFLSHIRTILVKQKASYNLLKEFEENIYTPKEFDRNTKTYISKPPLITKGKSTFEFIKKYYEHYIAIFDDDNYGINNSYEFYNLLTLMRIGLEADYWIAPILVYYDKHKTSNIIKFVSLLDAKFSSDWIIGLSPTDRIENINLIIKEIEEMTDQETLFNSNVFKVEKDDLLRVLSGGIYGRRYCKYLLLKIDLAYHGHTTKFSPPETISVEHILPQTPNKNSQWASEFSDQDREKWTNRIGNLILISRRKNSELSNLDYHYKKEKYFKKNIELFSNSVRIFNEYKTWKLDDLKNNHKTTLKKLLELYGITISEGDIEKLF